MIYFTDWRLDATGDIIARQYDNQSRTITITGALPEGWTWDLLVRAGDAYDEWPMTAQDGGIGCTLTAEMLAASGYYTLQLRGKQGEMVRHTNTIRVFIPESLSGDAQWPELPRAFSDAVDRAEGAADRAEAAAVHQPMISDDKTWLVWDADKGEYVDTGVSAGGGETADWNENDETSPQYIKNRTHYTYVQEAIAATDICTFKASDYMATNISLTTSLVTSLEYNVYRNNVKVCTSVCTEPEGYAFRQIMLDSGVFNVPLDTPSIGYYNGPSSNAQYRIERASADAKTIVHPLDVKYIPDAARNLGIIGADPGNFPMVMEVDATGVPTQWAAVPISQPATKIVSVTDSSEESELFFPFDTIKYRKVLISVSSTGYIGSGLSFAPIIDGKTTDSAISLDSMTNLSWCEMSIFRDPLYTFCTITVGSMRDFAKRTNSSILLLTDSTKEDGFVFKGLSVGQQITIWGM